MKKKIVILGSTGSIGKSLIKIISKDKKNFEIKLLTANSNYKELYKQAVLFNVKNLIITDKISYKLLKKKRNLRKINIFNNFSNLKKILPSKVDYTMSSISGLEGLEPTLKIISKTKKIAIANKEAIICGWNLINKELKKYRTNFIPVDSEHFSIWSLLNKEDYKSIKKIIITASGGPLINLPLNQIKNVPPKKALKHPNWSMGKKISIDSATMMNKVFEVIETQKIFGIAKSKIKILIHEKSYVHALIDFNNGLKKILVHDTNMQIPIFNTLYENENKFLKSKDLDINKMNNLNFKKIDEKRFPLVSLLKKIPDRNSLFETVLVSANDELVENYLNKKISFSGLQKILRFITNHKEFTIYKNKKPSNISKIYKLNDYVRLKVKKLCI